MSDELGTNPLSPSPVEISTKINHPIKTLSPKGILCLGLGLGSAELPQPKKALVNLPESGATTIKGI